MACRLNLQNSIVDLCLNRFHDYAQTVHNPKVAIVGKNLAENLMQLSFHKTSIELNSG